MLNLFRKHATSWMIKVLFGLIVIVFIFWGGYTYREQRETHVARVDDYYISIPEYNKSYDQLVDLYRRQMGNAFSEEIVRKLDLKKQALEMLVTRYLVGKAAQELGLRATPEEIKRKILEYPAFQTDGSFDKERYTFILRQNRLTPEEFESQVGSDLGAQKVEEFIKRRTVVTEEEILSDFRFHFSRIQLAYVSFDPKSFENLVVKDDKAVESYYQNHQDRYKDPEKRQISFVLFKPEAYMDQTRVTEIEIQQHYQDNQEEYHKEQEVKARHILFSVKEDAPEEEVNKVKAEAQKILEEARKGKDFAELAKKYSKDQGTAKQGGDLDYFNRERMVPAFSDAAFSLKPGEISDLVRSAFGFHIIKVEDIRPERTVPFEEVRGEIEQTLKRERARDFAFVKARDFADKAYAQKDIEKAAQAEKLDVAGSGVWLTQNDSLPDLAPTAPAVLTKLFGLPEKGTSEVTELPQGFIVAQVRAIQPPQLLPLEKVKDRIEKDYRTEQSRTLARQKASELLESARKMNSLDQAAMGGKLEMKTSDWFSRREPDKGLKLTGDAQNTAFQLTESQPFPEAPLEVMNRYIVWQLLGRNSPDESIEKERASISKKIEQQKQNMLWQSWMEEQRLKARVEMYREL